MKIQKSEPIIIGLVGFKESGKSFFATHLKNKYNFDVIAFALGLKSVARDVFGVVMEKDGVVHNPTKISELKKVTSDILEFNKMVDSALAFIGLNVNVSDIEPYKIRELYNIVANYYSIDIIEGKNEYARRFWQYFGTDIVHPINQKAWVEFLDGVIKHKLDVLENKIVIEDVRFFHELEYIKECNKMYGIKTYTIGIYNDKSKISEKTQGYKKHPSEIYIDALLKVCDKVVYNKYDDSFVKDIDNLIKTL